MLSAINSTTSVEISPSNASFLYREIPESKNYSPENFKRILEKLSIKNGAEVAYDPQTRIHTVQLNTADAEILQSKMNLHIESFNSWIQLQIQNEIANKAVDIQTGLLGNPAVCFILGKHIGPLAELSMSGVSFFRKDPSYPGVAIWNFDVVDKYETGTQMRNSIVEAFSAAINKINVNWQAPINQQSVSTTTKAYGILLRAQNVASLDKMLGLLNELNSRDISENLWSDIYKFRSYIDKEINVEITQYNDSLTKQQNSGGMQPYRSLDYLTMKDLPPHMKNLLDTITNTLRFESRLERYAVVFHLVETVKSHLKSINKFLALPSKTATDKENYKKDMSGLRNVLDELKNYPSADFDSFEKSIYNAFSFPRETATLLTEILVDLETRSALIIRNRDDDLPAAINRERQNVLDELNNLINKLDRLLKSPGFQVGIPYLDNSSYMHNLKVLQIRLALVPEMVDLSDKLKKVLTLFDELKKAITQEQDKQVPLTSNLRSSLVTIRDDISNSVIEFYNQTIDLIANVLIDIKTLVNQAASDKKSDANKVAGIYASLTMLARINVGIHDFNLQSLPESFHQATKDVNFPKNCQAIIGNLENVSKLCDQNVMKFTPAPSLSQLFALTSTTSSTSAILNVITPNHTPAPAAPLQPLTSSATTTQRRRFVNTGTPVSSKAVAQSSNPEKVTIFSDPTKILKNSGTNKIMQSVPEQPVPAGLTESVKQSPSPSIKK